ncbi:MAG: threonine/serine exporter family protein [Gammaproteobacteria bacterium]|nr:threonine/serine exporter family protein [Gammaproteobacteria bacterium]
MAREFFSKVGRKIKQYRFGLALAVAVVIGFVVYPLGIMVATGLGIYILWLALSAVVGFIGAELIKWLSTRFLQCFSKKWGKIIIDHLSDCVAVGALFLVASFFFPPLVIPGILFLTGPMVVNGIAFITGALITGVVKLFRRCFCPPADDNPSLPNDFSISNSSQHQESSQQSHLFHQHDHMNETVLIDEQHKRDILNKNERVNDEVMEKKGVLSNKHSKQKQNARLDHYIRDKKELNKFTDEFTDECTDESMEKEWLLSQQHSFNKHRPENIHIPSDTPSFSNKNKSSESAYTPSTILTMKSESRKKIWKKGWGIFTCCQSCCSDDDDYEPSDRESNESNVTHHQRDNTSFERYNDTDITSDVYRQSNLFLKEDLSVILESGHNSEDENPQNTQQQIITNSP